MENRELKPCKCGCRAELVSSQTFVWCDTKWYVQCESLDCDERTPKYEHKIDAVNDWNGRSENGT